MEKPYLSLSIYEFMKEFPDDQSCQNYLINLRWFNGFNCNRCQHAKYCVGITAVHRQCTKCRFDHSPTSGTVFHHLKFSLQKAFMIIYLVSTNKKGISSCELSRKLQLRQKTCWLFKQKLMKAMEQEIKLSDQIEVDETFVGGKETKTGAVGRKVLKKKIVAVAIQKKGKGIAFASCKVIQNTSTKELRSFFEQSIEKDAEIRSDKWRSYKKLQNDYPGLVMEKSDSGKNFKLLHRFIMSLKSWLRGQHHYVRNLQAYLDEYVWRFNRHGASKGLFYELINTAIQKPHCGYIQIKLNYQ